MLKESVVQFDNCRQTNCNRLLTIQCIKYKEMNGRCMNQIFERIQYIMQHVLKENIIKVKLI